MDKMSWLAKAEVLPALPEVALILIGELNASLPDFEKIVKAIESDPSMAARILRQANSALVGSPEPIHSVRRATEMLGLNAVATGALTIVISSLARARMVKSMPEYASLARLSAICCESLAPIAAVPAGVAFACGLLRPIGNLVMRAADPELMKLIDSKCAFAYPEREKVELEIAGVMQCQLSAALARKWRVGDFICDALDGRGKLGAAVGLADLAARRMLLPKSCAESFDELPNCKLWLAQLGMSKMDEHAWPTSSDVKRRFG